MDIEQQEMAAREYSMITHAARDLQGFMQQPFWVRLKSGVSDMKWDFFDDTPATMLGKWLRVRVRWDEHADERTPIFSLNREEDDKLMMFSPEEFQKYVTQIGPVKQMFKMHMKIIEANSK